MKGVYIEWLKSRRTKSFSIVTLLMIVATLWSIAMFMSVFSHPELKNVGTLFSNQNVNLLMLPIAVSVFVSRIVSNEREGQTFKLQATNGLGLMTIFRHKFLFTMVFFFVMSFAEIVAICCFGKQSGISIPMDIVGVQFLGQLLSIFALVSIYLTLAMVLEKQGVLLALGLLGGFLGIVLNPRSYGFASLLHPLTGAGSLAPYKYHFLGDGAYTYLLDQQLPWKLVFFMIYCLMLYGLANVILRKRGS